MAGRHQIGLNNKFRHLRRLGDFLGARDPKVVPANTDPSQWIFTIPWNLINADPEVVHVNFTEDLGGISSITVDPISLGNPAPNGGFEIDAGFAYKILAMEYDFTWPAGTPPAAASRIQLVHALTNNLGGPEVYPGGRGRNDIIIETGVPEYKTVYGMGSLIDGTGGEIPPSSFINRWFWRRNADATIASTGGLGMRSIATHRDSGTPYNQQNWPANVDLQVEGFLLKIPLELMPIVGI